MEFFELFNPKTLGVVLVLLILMLIGQWGYQQFVPPTVYHRELVVPGCKDYIALPLVKCKDGTQLKITHCRCMTHWVQVTDPKKIEWVVNTNPRGYRVE